jgi:hypothetical protein
MLWTSCVATLTLRIGMRYTLPTWIACLGFGKSQKLSRRTVVVTFPNEKKFLENISREEPPFT